MKCLYFIAVASVFDARGPDFLFFYFSAAIISLLGMLIVRGMVDRTRGMPPPPLPEQVNPRELAWLRGGSPALVQLTGLDLLQRGYLQPAGGRGWKEHPAPPPSQYLPKLTQRLLEIFKRGPSTATLLKEGSAEVAEEAKEYEERAQTEGLLMAPEARSLAGTIGNVLLFVLLAIGSIKIAVALARGHLNIGFLIILMMPTAILFQKVKKLPRLSWRGKAYVRQAQNAFPHLQASASRLASDADPLLLLAAGVYGMSVLESTSFASYHRYYQPIPASTSSGCSGSSSSGGGCSSGTSGSSSCSSGTSSCSSGSSGCGGGGCGGGGCGGCGSS